MPWPDALRSRAVAEERKLKRSSRKQRAHVAKRSEKTGYKGKCNAKKRNGSGRCTKAAGWGTDHLGLGACKLHGGSVPNHRKSAQVEMAMQSTEAFGIPRNVDPMDALLGELRLTSGIIEFYHSKIRELDDNGGGSLVGPVGSEGVNDQGVTYHPDFKANIYVRLHREEREHLVKVAKACIDAGIAERQVQIAETQGQQLANVIRVILAGVGVDLEDPKVRQVVRAALLEAAALDTSGRELESVA